MNQLSKYGPMLFIATHPSTPCMEWTDIAFHLILNVYYFNDIISVLVGVSCMHSHSQGKYTDKIPSEGGALESELAGAWRTRGTKGKFHHCYWAGWYIYKGCVSSPTAGRGPCEHWHCVWTSVPAGHSKIPFSCASKSMEMLLYSPVQLNKGTHRRSCELKSL